MTSKPGFQCNPGMSLAGAHLLARRRPACRRRESDPVASVRNAGRRGPILCSPPVVGVGARGSASSSRNCEALSTDSWRAGGPARSSGEAVVMTVELVNMNAGGGTVRLDGGPVTCGAVREMEVGWPSRAGLRRQALNHREGPWLKTVVLSVVGKGTT